MKNFFLFSLIFIFFACNDNVQTKKDIKKITKANTQDLTALDTSATGSKKNLINFEKGKVEYRKKLSSGIVLKWIERGAGPGFKSGEMALIDYRLGTPDGRIIDGNNRIDLPFIPFVVGYSMQTQGWDLAFAHLRVGDFVKIEIPAALAYGSKGIKDVLEPNTPNWLYVKVLSKIKPTIKNMVANRRNTTNPHNLSGQSVPIAIPKNKNIKLSVSFIQYLLPLNPNEYVFFQLSSLLILFLKP
jgi:FKBP-type peptidyl-prolyl cis-trans isomerase